MGEFEAKDERMQGYLSRVKFMQSKFDSFNLQHVPRSGNAHADSLAMLATSSAQNLPRVILVEDLHRPSVTVNISNQPSESGAKLDGFYHAILEGIYFA